MAYNYAFINKKTICFLHEQTQVSYDYIEKTVKHDKATIMSWEDTRNAIFPTVAQAKLLAKCYRMPFAALYMQQEHIKLETIPKLRNLRTINSENVVDDSSLNLSIIDLLRAREFFIDIQKELNNGNAIKKFSLTVKTDSVFECATEIRKVLGVDSTIQYACTSCRQFYLYLREKVEDTCILVHCFEGVPIDSARGISIYMGLLPIIGINDKDRYPAKSFSIIHELVHILRRTSTMCNDMFNSFTSSQEEVFCNAVAGEVLVPADALHIIMSGYENADLTINIIEKVAKHFSVSKEVIIRRLLDVSPPYISQKNYQDYADEFKLIYNNEKKERRIARIEGHLAGIPQYPDRMAMDRISLSLSRAFLHGYSEGIFNKQDISEYVRIKTKHIDKYLQEVSNWDN